MNEICNAMIVVIVWVFVTTTLYYRALWKNEETYRIDIQQLDSECIKKLEARPSPTGLEPR